MRKQQQQHQPVGTFGQSVELEGGGVTALWLAAQRYVYISRLQVGHMWQLSECVCVCGAATLCCFLSPLFAWWCFGWPAAWSRFFCCNQSGSKKVCLTSTVRIFIFLFFYLFLIYWHVVLFHSLSLRVSFYYCGFKKRTPVCLSHISYNTTVGVIKLGLGK